MKILKFFIILFGLMTLICNNTNSQAPNERAPLENMPVLPEIPDIELEEPSVSMELNFPDGGADAIDGGLTMRMTVSTQAHLTATTPAVLALRIYNYSLGDTTTLTSHPSITDSHTFTFVIAGAPNDELYIECGYIWLDGYRADSGCVVTIQP